ncbi:hypothetical protein CANCADRAFT_2665 [Tortispora caseinolytica NRRL Y-17796]|uniref:non-specific serine/threonine protein kinase n=1 Tax=Tortispora caseinolytica NRRL Y-17796 TaxID=767744 RepID=A0A1E4TGZ5_9ASCO|nr:hypothetical protein CANCADRAFT_2665 [Tortispora caseinolytica NRRL Y-17796]
MGGQLSRIAPPPANVGIDAYIAELKDIQYDSTLTTTRFLKSVLGLHSEGQVVVKVFVRPNNDIDLNTIADNLRKLSTALNSVPNILNYSRIVLTDRAGYLIRQYVGCNLYDRISVRPFLEDVEKKWIAFQTLTVLRDMHQLGYCHGDIKSENVLVTSWNWVFLTDIASFKPAYLPDNDPADFLFFYDVSQRHICYLAPERFYSLESGVISNTLTPAMDIFSAGCVIAELFLNGTPLFTLAQLFNYVSGNYTPPVDSIQDPDIRELVTHMISPSPENRLSADQYLNEFRNRCFPDYFYTFCHQYFANIYDIVPRRNASVSSFSESHEPDTHIERIFTDFDKISYFVGMNTCIKSFSDLNSDGSAIPVIIDIPNAERKLPSQFDDTSDTKDGCLLFLSAVLSSVLYSVRSSSRVMACELVLSFSEMLPDEIKLDRCIPYVIQLLKDPSPMVVIAALRTMTQLLALVRIIAPVNSQIFPVYILPNLGVLCDNPNSSVRSMYAQCLASLSESASRYLELVQALQASNSIAQQVDDSTEIEMEIAAFSQTAYDRSWKYLVSFFKEQVNRLMTDSDSSVRRSLLSSMSSLCVFLGNRNISEMLIGHLIAYLNDKDQMLRLAFFDSVVAITAFVGEVSIHEYIIPLMLQSLTDPDEHVIERIFYAFTSFAELGMIRRNRLWDMFRTAAAFSVHPNFALRLHVKSFFVAAAKLLDEVDIASFFKPTLRPYLVCDTNDYNVVSLSQVMVSPISRVVFDISISWAQRSEKSLFWENCRQQQWWRMINSSATPGVFGSYLLHQQSSIPLSKDDKSWVDKLQGAGLGSRDLWKIANLRDYIYRVATSLKFNKGEQILSNVDGSLSLAKHGLTPITVFAEDQSFAFDFEDHNSSVSTLRSTLGKDINPLRGSLVQGDSFRGTSSENRDLSSSFSDLHLISSNSHLHKPTNLLSDDTPLGKASAEIATSDALANGILEASSPANSLARPKKMSSSAKDRKLMFSYEGKNSYILKFLDNTYFDTFAKSLPELGPILSPYLRKDERRIISSNRQNNFLSKTLNEPWHPSDTFVAQFHDHNGPVNRVVVSPDHAFFLTASDDGTVKLWDAERLEKNVVNRAMQTYHHPKNAKVKSICFLGARHSFALAASNGDIAVVRVLVSSTAEDGLPSYGKFSVIRTYSLDEGHATHIAYAVIDKVETLLLSTSTGSIIALDLQNMDILWKLENPLEHGNILWFCVSRDSTWLVCGTSRGILDLWDLRFHLNLRSWGIPGRKPINRVEIHPSKQHSTWILVSGGSGRGEVTLWDIEKIQCRQVYRLDPGATKEWNLSYEPIKMGEDNSELDVESLILDSRASESVREGRLEASHSDHGFRAFVLGGAEENGNPEYMITSGVDRTVRFWDLNKPTQSCIVSGMVNDDVRVTYNSAYISAFLTVTTEQIKPVQNSPQAKRQSRISRTSLVTKEQQMLLKSHLDVVLDVAVMYNPYNVIISVDRAGTILVYR